MKQPLINWHKALVGAAAVLTFGWSRTRAGKLALRRAASALVGTALRLRSRRMSFDGLSKVLVIAPHPDDGALGCGGAVALMVRGAVEIHILYITDGGASHPGHPSLDPGAIAGIRHREAKSATALLGVDPGHVVFLDAPDGRLAKLAADPKGALSGRIADQLIPLRPDAIFLPSRHDASTEHEAAFEIVRGALGRAGLKPRVFEFPVWSWWNPSLLVPTVFGSASVWRVGLDGVREVKAQAVACYASQLQPLPPDIYSALPEGFASMFLGAHEFFFEH
jgi:LmbE family N-acetylglucosaminyl deacetylase